MRTGLVVHSKVTARNTAVQDAATEAIRRQASSNPYRKPTRNVAGSAATVEQPLPRETEAHGREPSISKVLSLQDTNVSVYNGLGVEMYLGKQVQFGDLSHITLVKVDDGLVPICTAGIDAMIQEVFGE